MADTAFDDDIWNWKLISTNFLFRIEIVTPLKNIYFTLHTKLTFIINNSYNYIMWNYVKSKFEEDNGKLPIEYFSTCWIFINIIRKEKKNFIINLSIKYFLD